VPATLEVCAAHEKVSARKTTHANDNLSHRIFTTENMLASVTFKSSHPVAQALLAVEEQ
jgi:hypothetical protein